MQDKNCFAYQSILVFTLLISFLVSPRFAAAQALKEIRIASSNISITNLPMFYARERKFFEREGFDAKIIIVQTNAGLAALTNGDVDYGTFSTSAIEATLKGMPIRLLAVTTEYPPASLVVRKEIMKVTDLKGKKLGVNSYGGTAYGTATFVLKHYGLNPKERHDSRHGRYRGAHRRFKVSVRGCRDHYPAGRYEGGGAGRFQDLAGCGDDLQAAERRDQRRAKENQREFR